MQFAVRCCKVTFLCDCLVLYFCIRVVIEEETDSEQANCYQRASTTDEKTSVTEKEEESVDRKR